MNVARSSTKVFVANIASTVLGFIGLAFFARELTPTLFGVFVLFRSLVDIFAFGIDFSISSAVQKRISEGQDAEVFFSSGVLIKLALFLVTTSILLLLRDPINAYIGIDATVLLIAAIALNDLGSLMVNVLRGELRVGATAVLGFSMRFFWLTVGTAFVLSGFGARGIIYGLIVGFAVRFLWAVYRSSTRLGRPSIKHARSLFDFAKYDFIGGLGSQAFSWLDVLIIGWFLTQAEVGMYEVAWRVAGVTLLLSNAIRFSVFPQVSALNADGSADRIERLINNLLTPSLFFVIPSLFGVALLARRILGLVFGPAYVAAWLVLIVLTAMNLFGAVQAIITQCLLGIDQPGLNARATLVAIVLNLVLNVAFVLHFGILGAAVATATAAAVNLALTFMYLSRFLTIRFPYREVGWCVVAAVIMSAAIRWLQILVGIDTIPKLLLVIFLGALVYGAVVLASKQLRERIVSNARTLLG